MGSDCFRLTVSAIRGTTVTLDLVVAEAFNGQVVPGHGAFTWALQALYEATWVPLETPGKGGAVADRSASALARAFTVEEILDQQSVNKKLATILKQMVWLEARNYPIVDLHAYNTDEWHRFPERAAWCRYEIGTTAKKWIQHVRPAMSWMSRASGWDLTSYAPPSYEDGRLVSDPTRSAPRVPV
jgi:hypothetical protein